MMKKNAFNVRHASTSAPSMPFLLTKLCTLTMNPVFGCLQCIKNCPQRALSHEGEQKNLEEVVHTCLQDIDFYEESGGGVTISGGEGMLVSRNL